MTARGGTPLKYKYLVRRYTQHPEATFPLVTFVAQAGDIIQWAGVPRKARGTKKGTPAGFQRALSDTRLEDIDNFFEKPSNVSPTAVVVAFREGQASLEAVPDEVASTLLGNTDPGELYWLEFEVPDFSSTDTSDLIDEFIAATDSRITASEASSSLTIDDHEVSEENGEDLEAQSAMSRPEASDPDAEDDDELLVQTSHLQSFVAWLRDVREHIEENASLPAGVSEGDLRETLESMMLPAMLVDGQHRTFGAQVHDEEIPFCVCGLIDAPWEEQVLQFVVINNKAEKIPTPFLNAIISSSLTQAEAKRLEERLEESGVRLSVTQVMHKLDTDPQSPFRSMIRFQVAGESGWLGYAGMKRIALKWWNLSNPQFTQLVGNLLDAESYGEQRIEWKNGAWWDYFATFWDVIRQKYGESDVGGDRMWRDRESQLMRLATLETLQDLFIEWMYYSMRQFPEDIESFRKEVQLWCNNLPIEFFREEWKGIKLPKDRDLLKYYLKETTVNPKYHFRKTRVFQDRS